MTQQHMTDLHGRSLMDWLGTLGYVFAFLMLALVMMGIVCISKRPLPKLSFTQQD